MFAEPWTGGTPDEQPGALPEILPSPDFDRPGPRDANIDRCWTCRAMFVQAWGHYGTVWPVVHQQLGVRPDTLRFDTLQEDRQAMNGAATLKRIEVISGRAGREHRFPPTASCARERAT